MKTRRLAARASLLSACTALATGAWASPPTYVLIDMGGLPGSMSTCVADVNNSGTAVGSCYFRVGAFGGYYKAFRWVNGQMTALDSLGGRQTKAAAINNSGLIVGQSEYDTSSNKHACVWAPGHAVADLGTLGGASSWANAINDHGDIVGTAWLLPGLGAQACTWTTKGITPLGVLGGGITNLYSDAYAINDQFTIVGSSDGVLGYPNAFRWGDGALTNLTPSALLAQARAVNNAGTVVGLNRWGSDGFAAVFLPSGPVNMGALPGDTASAANSINSAGVIVGNSARFNGGGRATMWTSTSVSGIHDLNTMMVPLPGLVLTDATAISDTGLIVCTGTIASQTRSYMLMARCPSDLDDGSGAGRPDGGVTIDDLLFFLTAFPDGDLRADLDDGSGTGTSDGGVTIDDLLYFLFHFAGGC